MVSSQPEAIEDDESDCLARVLVGACKCLPWQYNWEGEEDVCTGGSYNCSLAVLGLHEAGGGDCQVTVWLVEQRMKMSLTREVREACRCRAGVRYSVHQVSNITIITIVTTISYQAGVAGCGGVPDSLTLIPDKNQHTPDTHSWLDILATVGGIVSIITGMSILSGCELLYWLTVRWGQESRKVEGGTTSRSPPRTAWTENNERDGWENKELSDKKF